MKLKLPRPTYANVMSTIAVMLALGGSAYAITINSSNVKDDSLLSRDIHDGTVRAIDLESNAVTRPKIATNAITGAKIADSTITEDDVNALAVARWRNDVNESNNTGSIDVEDNAPKVVAGNGEDVRTVTCGSTANAISGGVSSDTSDIKVTVSHAADSGHGWLVKVMNPSPDPVSVTYYAMCIQ